MNRRNALTVGAAILCALAVSGAPSLADPGGACIETAMKQGVAAFPAVACGARSAE